MDFENMTADGVPAPELSAREKRAFEMAMTGSTRQQIGAELSMSRRKVSAALIKAGIEPAKRALRQGALERLMLKEHQREQAAEDRKSELAAREHAIEEKQRAIKEKKKQREIEVVGLYNEGLLQIEIAAKLGVSHSHISNILRSAQVRVRKGIVRDQFHIRPPVIKTDAEINTEIAYNAVKAALFPTTGARNEK
jgi:DNA-binding NarL/FixJ family response regulator